MPDPGASHAHTRLGRLALIATTLLWGSSFTIMKDALATVPALWLLAIRFSGAAMLMALIGIRSLRRLDRGYLTGGACMGVCLYLAYTIQTYGLVHTTPGKNAFLAATYCVFVPFFWWLSISGGRTGTTSRRRFCACAAWGSCPCRATCASAAARG